MKRFVARLSVLIGIIAAGTIAIAQAQRMVEPRDETATPEASVDAAASQTAPTDASPAATDVVKLDAEEVALRGQGGDDPFRSVPRGSETTPVETPNETPAMLPENPTARPLDQQPHAAAPTADDDFPNASDVFGESTGPTGPQQLPQTSQQPTDSTLAQAADATAARYEPETDTVPPQGDRYRDFQPAAEAPLEPVASDNVPGAGVAEGGQVAPPDVPSAVDPTGRYRDAPPSDNENLVAVPSGDDAFNRPQSLASGSDPSMALASEPLTQPLESNDQNAMATGRPGPQGLEGPQVPTVSIEKVAPPELQVGEAAKILIKLRNSGTVAAQDVVVRDQVPEGARLVSTNPRATTDELGNLIWSLGTLSAGATEDIEVEIIPTTEGEIGSVASVTLRAEASSRVRVTQPALALEVAATPQVMVGGDVQLSIRVTNTGSGVARDVVLYAQLPEQVHHPAGRELEYDIDSLAPGDSREIELTLRADAAGRIQHSLMARGAGDLVAEAPFEFEIIAPALAVAIDGPSRRYLEREATYRLSVSNPGTASARNVRLVAQLPDGMQFEEADNLGQFDSAQRTVTWLLEELPPGQSGDVALSVLPTSPGVQKITVDAVAQSDLEAHAETTVAVEGVVAIFFEVADVEDPIEADGQTTYEIRIVNQGTKTATNVEVAALVPAELQAVDAEAPVRHVIDGQRVLFDPMPKLAPKADTTYRVKVKALSPGDLRFRVQVRTAELQTPVTKEESTRVYSDE